MSDEIIGRVAEWLEAAADHAEIFEPTAMVLATADTSGQPSARVVLLKAFDERGFGFYTNMESRKGRDITANPKGALCFYWMPLLRQLRVEGSIEEVSAEEADEYFASRSRESRIGAWASAQSREVENRHVLMQRVEEETKRFEGKDVPRPPYWKGLRLIPQRIEFWQQAPYRLHDRDVYERSDNGWRRTKLNP